ncbi:restriction endonuclease subunit S [Stutzerimonas kunmingensis]|uniref:restriction endonuclease subunit S n=1 Tax=Stutzerimonas kunmingensis TaxID=1211807 RepID=UPI0028AC37E7|nr:restriction endonuclease subunit S [Stutzerimonas kunmingensis]
MADSKNLKPGWRRVKFGDVVQLSKARSQDPLADGIERYVGLEHLEPGDLRIRSWGNVADGVTFTNVFKPGQVLFGKRRAYQRKVAVADFSGVCSGDIYVLESKDASVLLPELLPFICQTDAFFDHAVGTSAGSLSPRTNWTSLAGFEFPLPPHADQQAIVEKLNCATDVVRSAQDLEATTKALLSSYLAEVVVVSSDSVPLQDLCSSPITYGIVQAGPDLQVGIPYVRVSEMTNCDELDPLQMMKTSEEVHQSYARTILEEGDIVIALRGVPGLVHMVPPALAGGNLSRGVARISPGSRCLGAYLLWAIRSPVVQRSVLQYANGWKGEDLREITITDLRRLPIPLPHQNRQEEIANKAADIQTAISNARRRVDAARAMQCAMTAQALSGGV